MLFVVIVVRLWTGVMKMTEIRKTASLVLDVLKEHPTTRNSDMLLYLKVCEICNPEALKKPLCDVLPSLKEYGLPPFETVRRARQKLQAVFPYLGSNDRVQAFREEKEKEFREFARG